MFHDKKYILHSVLMIIMGLIVLAIFIIPNIRFSPFLIGDFMNPQNFTAVVLILTGTIILLYRYLQGKTEIELNRKYFRHLIKTVENIPSKQELLKINEDIKTTLESLQKLNLGLGFKDSEKKEVISYLKKEIRDLASEGFLSSIEERYAPTIIKKFEYSKLIDDYDNLISRLIEETLALTRRANSNLAIGSVLTILAMLSLAYIVMTAHIKYTDIASVLSYYIPRISFIIFIEIFAYFFLKLYKSNLQDIKYYQNELTNIQSRIIALKVSLMLEDQESCREVIKLLSVTERNFILKKGETTVELEKSKLDVQQIKEILNIGRIVPKLNRLK